MTGAQLNSWGQTLNLGTGVLPEGPQRPHPNAKADTLWPFQLLRVTPRLVFLGLGYQ